MIYHPESIADDVYGLIDYDQQHDRIWLSGDQVRCQGWECRLSPLLNGQWAYTLTQCRGPMSSWSNCLVGTFTERYDAIAACIKELRFHYRKHEQFLGRLKQKASE